MHNHNITYGNNLVLGLQLSSYCVWVSFPQFAQIFFSSDLKHWQYVSLAEWVGLSWVRTLHLLCPQGDLNGLVGWEFAFLQRWCKGFLYITSRQLCQWLITDSISAKVVTSSSKKNHGRPTSLQRQCFVDLTSLSNAPPHHGAHSTLNIRSAPKLVRYSLTVLSLKTFLRYLDAALNVLSLSDMTPGREYFRHQRKVSVVWPDVASLLLHSK